MGMLHVTCRPCRRTLDRSRWTNSRQWTSCRPEAACRCRSRRFSRRSLGTPCEQPAPRDTHVCIVWCKWQNMTKCDKMWGSSVAANVWVLLFEQISLLIRISMIIMAAMWWRWWFIPMHNMMTWSTLSARRMSPLLRVSIAFTPSGVTLQLWRVMRDLNQNSHVNKCDGDSN